MSQINELPTIQDVFNLIQEKYPTWFVDILDDYSSDYPHLKDNWKYMSKQSKSDMQKIIIVEKFANEQHLSYAELLTHAGFVVRTKSDIQPCSVCKLAIPSEHMYNKMKEIKRDMPSIWVNKCKTC